MLFTDIVNQRTDILSKALIENRNLTEEEIAQTTHLDKVYSIVSGKIFLLTLERGIKTRKAFILSLGRIKMTCNICDRAFSRAALYQIIREEGIKAVCVNCSLDSVYLADEAGLIDWQEAGGE